MNDSTTTQPQTGEVPDASGVQQGSAGSKNASQRGTTHPAAAEESAGAAGESAGSESDDPEHESCELGGSCSSKCEGTTVTCGIESTGFACEFEGFTGATTEVACGQRAVIGTACCGGCGCVPVEVFFDGKQCWQGAPQCALPALNNHFFDPHPTTTPNSSFVPPSSFYLGSGGVPGSEAAGGSPSLGGATFVTGGAGGADGGSGGAQGGARDSGGAASTPEAGATAAEPEAGSANLPTAGASAGTGDVPAGDAAAGAAGMATAGSAAAAY